VAGQGLNLGLRDAWELAQMLLDVAKEEIGAPRFLARYAVAAVRPLLRNRFTDFLVRISRILLRRSRWPAVRAWPRSMPCRLRGAFSPSHDLRRSRAALNGTAPFLPAGREKSGVNCFCCAKRWSASLSAHV